MHLNAVGGDCPGKTELHRGDAGAAGAVFVEYEPQTRIEGDIQQMPADFAVTEFWRGAGRRARRAGDDAEVTVFDSVGFALEDFAALRFLHGLHREVRRARQHGRSATVLETTGRTSTRCSTAARHGRVAVRRR